MEIKNSADLKAAIAELETKKVIQKKRLEDNFHAVKESLKPMNIVKNTFQKVKESPGIKGGLLKAALGIGVGLISKKLLITKSPGIVRRLVSSAVEMGVAGLVAKNSHTIKSKGNSLIKTLFSPKKKHGLI